MPTQFSQNVQPPDSDNREIDPQGLGDTGDQHTNDCSFPAGKVAGAPLFVSWFIVIFTIYQALEWMKNTSRPIWFRLALVIGNQIILYSSVLVHELGHGSMARYIGGEIEKILLWPFGGICFASTPEVEDPRQELKNTLKVVVAGPVTHFPQTAVWLLLLGTFEFASGLTDVVPLWSRVIPFARAPYPTSIETDIGYLLYAWMAWGIEINVLSFVFNVFFPMYPMDCAQMLVCSVQLFCGTSARTAALVLICCAVPCAVLLLCNGAMNFVTGGFMAGISGYIGLMSLADAWEIYKLRRDRKLYTHPLFMSARSHTRDVVDSFGLTRRLNTAEHDDMEVPAKAGSGQSIQCAIRNTFSGSGYVLATGESAGSSNATPDSSFKATHAESRALWLSRLEEVAANRQKGVQQLEEEQLERQRLENKQAQQQKLT